MPRSVVVECSHPGCATLTMGELCIEHEEPVLRSFSRGRPFPPIGPAAGIPRIDPLSAHSAFQQPVLTGAWR